MTDRESSGTHAPFPQEIATGEVVLTLVPDQVYIEVADALAPAALEALLASYRLRQVPEAPGRFPREDVDEGSFRGGRLQATTGEDMTRLIGGLRADDRVRTASPVYHRADFVPAETVTSFADQLLVHFDARAADAEISELIAALGTEDVAAEPLAREGTLHQVRLRLPKQQDVFAIAAEFARSPLVRYAGPDWIQLQSPASTAMPNDPLFITQPQWNLHTIAAPDGWDITQGSRRVVIAIVDTGCALDHPDLVAKYVPVADRFDVLTGTNIPNDLSNHGTLCAGIAAAQTNNKLGIAGVAPNCSIMPIRLYDGRKEGIRSQLDIVRAINWAVTHGADVISMSWYYNLKHELVDIALSSAHAANVVLVAATGNCFSDKGCDDPTTIDYPASHWTVMAVGATDQNDHRKTPASPDLPRWHSKYGPRLSVMAPGVLCWTTSLGGTTGYETFYGTSAAAPHVAGLAALIMSWHPPAGKWGRVWYGDPPRNDLTNDQVREIIEATADKVGGYPYDQDSAHSHGTWHYEMGYGRINVADALVFARDYATHKFERVSRDYARTVLILFGLSPGGSGVVLTSGGKPVPVDPGWQHLTPVQRDVLLGLAITELAKGIDDPETRQALARAGWAAIERTAQQRGHA
jgi:hypothetical protein